MLVSEIITDFLKFSGIECVFGIIGSANSRLYHSFTENSIEIINVHNEQSAVIAAGAYYRTTGKIAVALVTAGGGASNSVTGIVGAWADSIPTIILSGQEQYKYVQEHSSRRMYGTQGFDFPHMVSKTTKYAKTIQTKEEIQDELEKSYSIMMNGRKGPVLLDIPFEIQGADIDKREWNTYIPHKYIPNRENIDTIKQLLRDSKRPVILAGHGIKLSNSVDAFKEMTNSIKVPILLTWSGIDILSNDHPMNFGRPGVYGQRGANFIQQKSDFLLVLGSRLTLPQSGYNFDEFARNAKVIMVDIDDTEKKSFVDIFVHGDCKYIIEELKTMKYENDEWIQICNTIRDKFPYVDDTHKEDGFPNSYRIIDKISDHLKDDQIIVTDMGTAILSGHQSIRLKKNQKMFSSYGLGEMGYGLPAAIGASISSRDKEILCLNCDGSMMMNLQELQPIIQYNLRVKIIIFNNDGYLMIKHTQDMLFKGKYTAVDKKTGLVLPNYMDLANAFGYKGYKIYNWDDFNIKFTEFMEFDGPSICEIYMHPHQDFIPKVKGVFNSKTNQIFAPPLEEMSPLLNMNTIEEIMQTDISSYSPHLSRS